MRKMAYLTVHLTMSATRIYHVTNPHRLVWAHTITSGPATKHLVCSCLYPLQDYPATLYAMLVITCHLVPQLACHATWDPTVWVVQTYTTLGQPFQCSSAQIAQEVASMPTANLGSPWITTSPAATIQPTVILIPVFISLHSSSATRATLSSLPIVSMLKTVACGCNAMVFASQSMARKCCRLCPLCFHGRLFASMSLQEHTSSVGHTTKTTVSRLVRIVQPSRASSCLEHNHSSRHALCAPLARFPSTKAAPNANSVDSTRQLVPLDRPHVPLACRHSMLSRVAQPAPPILRAQPAITTWSTYLAT